VGKGLVFGNEIARLRNIKADGQNSEEFIKLGGNIANLRDYIIVIVKLSLDKKKEQITSNAFLNDPKQCFVVTKYLDYKNITPFDNKTMQEVMGKEKLDKYLLLFSKFVNNSKRIYRIEGPIEYLLEEIDFLNKEKATGRESK
jgi:hypothetical protein